MKYLVMILAVAACSTEDVADKPEVAAVKAECGKLLEHIVRISPEAKGEDAAKLAAALPVEEIDSCTAAEPEARACMLAAADVAAVRACIPKDDILGCMQTAKAFPLIRAKCWAGDPKAAAVLTKPILDCAARAGDAHPEITAQCFANPHAADGIAPPE